MAKERREKNHRDSMKKVPLGLRERMFVRGREREKGERARGEGKRALWCRKIGASERVLHQYR